ncbi:glycerophosphodiester phosphodiesterase family protein [uncultured Shimia sp.]|uniref:glycerophosphodiester phosphodiesterase family protein n=1 Tax=uncultured Shimia sp. TaxID=573152 RepID=UPI0026291C8B|nr:glycerophosphodiester phosphodiesterase family protein [uncultured Shimia sp.]
MREMTVQTAFGQAWALKRPLLASTLVVNILLTAFMAPFMALVMRSLLSLSGQPALSDFDIAVFLFSPIGFAALIIVAGLAISLQVMNIAFMMSAALGARQTGSFEVGQGLAILMQRWRAVLSFAVRLALRILAIALPFVAVAGGIYLTWLTEFDINFYLSTRPPVFFGVVAGAGAVVAIGALLLVRQLVGWSLALSLVLFEDIAPGKSFALSVEKMEGHRKALLVKLIVWGVVASILGSLLFATTGVVADAFLAFFHSDIRVLARVLVAFALIWAALNLLVTSICSGALAVLLMDYAGWPGMSRPVPPSKARSLKVLILIGGLTCAVFGVLGVVGLAQTKVADQVEVIAHRGAAGSRPENTMASIEQAIQDAADWVEIDVQETADDQVIVIHDSDFMKIGGDPIKVWDATMDDVARIDIGSWFDPSYADQRAPLLSDVLETAKDRAGVLIELKYYGHDVALEQRVAGIVTATGMETQVKAMSLKLPAVQKMKAIRPDWEVGLLSSASAGRIWELDIDFLAVNKAAVSTRLVREMRSAGKKLYVWTVNEPLEMSRMISMGVDGLITDEPALARDVISQRRDLSSAERLVLALANFVGVAAEVGTYRDDSP